MRWWNCVGFISSFVNSARLYVDSAPAICRCTIVGALLHWNSRNLSGTRGAATDRVAPQSTESHQSQPREREVSISSNISEYICLYLFIWKHIGCPETHGHSSQAFRSWARLSRAYCSRFKFLWLFSWELSWKSATFHFRYLDLWTMNLFEILNVVT